MNTITRTAEFDLWLKRLKDNTATYKIVMRVKRAERGNFGDNHSVGDGVSEMRIDWGPGYRVYFAQKGSTIYLLLLGGDKRTQSADIAKAKAIWKEHKGE